MSTRVIKYLDPKNDLTFRKIFGEHPHIMQSFLNSVLPLDENQHIETLTYEDPAMIPELPELKHSIVDVRCTDNYNRQFIVEMQMYWTTSFKNRMLFNAGKAYIKQIDKASKYSELCPVYGLSLVNDIYLPEKEYENQFYHHYRLAHQEIPDEVVSGIELIFIELPKFKATTFTDRKVRNLWLRFLTEIDEDTKEVSEELYSEEAIKEALEHLQVSAFTKNQLAYYDKYWNKIRIEKAAIDDAIKKSKIKIAEAKIKIAEAQEREQEAKEQEQKAKEQEQKAKEREQEERQQKEESQKREQKSQIKLAKKMLKYGEPIKEIEKETSLTTNEIENLQ